MNKERQGKRQAGGALLPFPEFPKPAPTVVLWEERRRPDETELRRRLEDEGYQAVKWTSEPHQAYVAHAHIYPELLWLLTGSITVILPVDRRILELGPGDRVETPAGIMHAIVAGPDGAGYLVATRL